MAFFSAASTPTCNYVLDSTSDYTITNTITYKDVTNTLYELNNQRQLGNNHAIANIAWTSDASGTGIQSQISTQGQTSTQGQISTPAGYSWGDYSTDAIYYNNSDTTIKFCTSDSGICTATVDAFGHYELDKREKFKSNLIIRRKSRASLIQNVDVNEEIAIETLREMILESEYRKYMKYGFVLVKGKSGDVYQVFRNKSHTRIWRDGKIIEEVCVRIAYEANVPPTDNVIAFKTMIECNEQEFKKSGNVYKMLKVA